MSSDADSHWHATAYPLMVGIFPASMLLPLPVIAFSHSMISVVLGVAWMVLTYWLRSKGLGLSGVVVLVRRALQGDHLPPKI